jgi:DNA-binding transcriptional ArsR family regulator
MFPAYRGGMEVARIARLIGEPARATMLDALLSGEALSAGELARAARVSPATASGHLARLQAGGLVDVVRAGRHRYYRIAAPEAAEALEALSLLGTAPPVRSLRASRAAAAMAEARTCYDHLAGRVGVALCDALVAREALVAGGDGYVLTPAGEKLLGELDVAVEPTRRSFARPCIDFTERRPHLAGALGAAVCGRLMELRWLVRRAPGERALRVTESGRAGLAEWLGI